MAKRSSVVAHHSAHSAHYSQLVAMVLDVIENNPHFATTSLKKHPNLATLAQQFLTRMMQTLAAKLLPKDGLLVVEPLLLLWNGIMKDVLAQGFSIKDTALLIYAFKIGYTSYCARHSLADTVPFDQFEPLLDALGMVTFEMYSVENERLISRKDHQIQYLQNKDDQDFPEIIGTSPAMKHLFKAIGLVLDNDLTVLIEGESGTGKDLIANVIHKHSKRANKPFVAINCGAIPKELIESELFGHEKGAFTGADSKRIGKFELADGGTLFLDEIAELSMDLQVKFLRVLQNREIQRLGSDHPHRIDVRIIAATNQNLKQAVDNKRFRLDLFYRLNVYPLYVPALRDRREDIPALILHFLSRYAADLALTLPDITEEAMYYLSQAYWEGNIRELENTIQRALILSQGQPITRALVSSTVTLNNHDVPTPVVPYLNQPKPPQQIKRLDEVEKEAIEDALVYFKGNIAAVSKACGITRSTLYSKLKKYKIRDDFSK